jgi:hypothetical protein
MPEVEIGTEKLACPQMKRARCESGQACPALNPLLIMLAGKPPRSVCCSLRASCQEPESEDDR